MCCNQQPQQRAHNNNGTAQGKVVAKQFHLQKEIGRGAHAVVWEGEDLKTNERVAVKVIKHGGKAQGALQEAKLLLPLKHRNVVGLRRVASSAHHLYLVQDLCTKGDLFDHILDAWAQNGHGTQGLCEERARALFLDLASAVSFLHAHGVAHRDIKPENCLLADDGRLVLSDFGFATKREHCSARCGTVPFMAPELLATPHHHHNDDDGNDNGNDGNDKPQFNTAALDVWACGVVLYAMLTARLPFDAPTDGEIRHKIVAGRFVFPESVGADARDLVRWVLQADPSKRPTIHDVLSHPFLATTRC